MSYEKQNFKIVECILVDGKTEETTEPKDYIVDIATTDGVSFTTTSSI